MQVCKCQKTREWPSLLLLLSLLMLLFVALAAPVPAAAPFCHDVLSPLFIEPLAIEKKSSNWAISCLFNPSVDTRPSSCSNPTNEVLASCEHKGYSPRLHSILTPSLLFRSFFLSLFLYTFHCLTAPHSSRTVARFHKVSGAWQRP